jgi:hydroxylamine reductase (hybrid-cluster protein)
VQTAANTFLHRRGKDVHIPAVLNQIHTGYTAANSKQVLKTLKATSASGAIKGVVYLGGCGNIANTQDAQMVQTAARLLSAGYLIVTAGCAGAALAKAGMCRPEYVLRDGQKGISGTGTSPVLHIGSCHDAGEFLMMARDIQLSGIPAFAVMQEISHNKVLATAIAFASKGINTYIDLGETTSIPDIRLPGMVLPITDLEQLMPKSADAAAAQ